MILDFSIFQWINNVAGKNIWLDSLAIFFAEYFQYVVVLLLFLILVINRRKYLRMVIAAISAAIFSRFIVSEIARFIFPRSRPFVDNNVNLVIFHSSGEPSFPSGHASFFFALSTVIYFYNKKTGLLFYVASFLISISRVFVGIHWPSDILAGAIVGIFSGWFINKLSKRFSQQKAPQ